MRLASRASRMAEKRHSYRFLVAGNLKDRNRLETLDVDARIILKRILKK